jgi:hypothetical protein
MRPADLDFLKYFDNFPHSNRIGDIIYKHSNPFWENLFKERSRGKDVYERVPKSDVRWARAWAEMSMLLAEMM